MPVGPTGTRRHKSCRSSFVLALGGQTTQLRNSMLILCRLDSRQSVTRHRYSKLPHLHECDRAETAKDSVLAIELVTESRVVMFKV